MLLFWKCLLCFVLSVLVVKSCTYCSPIPCLLSMHSACFVCQDLFIVSRQPHPPFPGAHKCLVTNTQMFLFFPPSRIHPSSSFASDVFGVLHKDVTVSVEFQDLPQSLLGCGHSFFGPLAFCGLIADWWGVGGMPLGGVQWWRHGGVTVLVVCL